MANAEIGLYSILATTAPCIYLSLPIANKELYILEPYPWFHPGQKYIFGLVETFMHAALAMPATVAALSAIFQAFPALCPCEPRLPRGEMQPAPCGVRSNTRLISASISQPPPAGIRSVRKYNTGICPFVQYKRSLHSDTSSYPAREKKAHRVNHAHRRFRSCLGERPPARQESAGRFTLVCTHAPAPTSRSEAEMAKGGAHTKPHTNPIHMCTAATAAVVLLLRLT